MQLTRRSARRIDSGTTALGFGRTDDDDTDGAGEMRETRRVADDCHSERSEESLPGLPKIPRCARDDRKAVASHLATRLCLLRKTQFVSVRIHDRELPLPIERVVDVLDEAHLGVRRL